MTNHARALTPCLLALTSWIAVAGCGDDTSNATGPGSGAGGAGASSNAGPGGGGQPGLGGDGAGGDEPECEGPKVEATPTTVAIQSVEADIVDLKGDPVADIPAQVCGLDICISGTTDEKGHVLVSVQGKELANPAFKYGDGFRVAKFAQPLTEPTLKLGTVTTAKLPAEGKPFTPGSALVSGDVTLKLAADAVVVVDDLEYDDEEEQLFRAVTIPIAQAPVAVPAELGLEMLFGTGPIATRLCPAAEVSVPNTPKWPAGAEVEFYVHGVDGFQYWAPYAGWTKISDGKVSADGATVTTEGGAGLPIVTTFGVALKKR